VWFTYAPRECTKKCEFRPLSKAQEVAEIPVITDGRTDEQIGREEGRTLSNDDQPASRSPAVWFPRSWTCD
jgi:hypothetical protein